MRPRHRLMLIGCLAALTASASFGAGVTVLGGLTRKATLAPGESTAGKIAVVNITEKPQIVKVFQTDYLFYAEGRDVYGGPGTTSRSNASWIVFTPREFTVPPKTTCVIRYRLRVPQDESLVGTYWSMLMVEPVAEETRMPPRKSDRPRIGIRVVMRYGVQMVTDIQDTGKREIKFLDQRLVAKDGKRIFQFDIENTGERWLRLTVWAEVRDDEGASMGRFDAAPLRLYPECSGRFKVDLTGLPAGKYEALIVADNGDGYVFRRRCRLETN